MTMTRRTTMLFTALAALAPRGTHAEAARCCPVVELRQYTLHPGQRDVLIELFEREFIEPQEALGMSIIATFRDLDKPDRFVWLRGFTDMAARPTALQTFYTGPVWKAHNKAANATMIDSDNVLLLRPARPNSGFTLDRSTRAPVGAAGIKGLVTATIYYFDKPADAAFQNLFEAEAAPLLRQTGATPIASFVTESAANNFPALPVREGEDVFVWFAAFADQADHAAHQVKLNQSAAWKTLSTRIRAQLKRDPEVLRLEPTPRSLLRS